MIRQNLGMAATLLREERANGLPVVAICALSRTAAILVALYRSEFSGEDVECLRVNLERFKKRWGVCGMSFYLYFILHVLEMW